MAILAPVLALLSLLAATTHACTTKNKAFYLSLSDSQLFAEGLSPKRIGKCYIVRARYGACDLYVKAALAGPRGDRGYPKTRSNLGTGCVRAPDYPKRVRICYYKDPAYPLTAAERVSFCTDSGNVNAAAQLRHAIRNDKCALPAGGGCCSRGSCGGVFGKCCRGYYCRYGYCSRYRPRCGYCRNSRKFCCSNSDCPNRLCILGGGPDAIAPKL